MPTVLWTPRFVNYTIDDYEPNHDELINHMAEVQRSQHRRKKMPSSSITNILPKMERLNGPYGMYATVYGLTKVIHVGHPLPAREILNGSSIGHKSGGRVDTEGEQWRSWDVLFQLRTFFTSSKSRNKGQKRRSSSILSESTGSTKSPAYNHFQNFSGNGVFTANGTDWKSKRASLIHCLLGSNIMNNLENEVNNSAHGLLDELDRLDDGGEVVNVVPMLQRCTIGLIYRIITHHNLFGEEDDNDNGEEESDTVTTSSPRSSATSLSSMCVTTSEMESKASQPSDNIHVNDAHPTKQQSNPIKALLPTYLQSVTQIRMIILAQSRSIWYLLPRFAYRLFSPMYREEERVMGPIREFARLTCLNAKRGSPLELLSQRDSHNSNNASSVDGITKDMLDEAITLLFAGQDTSAATLSWTLHLLSLDPERQTRLLEEVRSTIVKDDDAEKDFVSKAMIAQMPYLDAVIKESMRLYPVAPFVVRKLTADINIPREKDAATNNAATADTILPASTFACIWIYALHRNPKLWHSPEEFIPERWIDHELREKDAGQEEPGAYIPFAMGPRNCLGRPLAQVILRVLLARILNRYSVVDPRYKALKQRQHSTDHDIDTKCLRKDMQAGFTVLPSNGLMLRFVKREQ